MGRPRSVRKAVLFGTTVLAMPWLSAAAQSQDPQPLPTEELSQAPIEELVVTGTFIPDEKRATSEISNLLDADDFLRTGDGLAVDALKRVTGLSVVDGKFVFVRGLGGRYSTTLFNGSNFPSPEPLTRTVPLDLFPTAVLDSTLVQKTWSPQFPGQFGGGVVELRSKGIPDEEFISVSVGTGFNTVSTFSDGLLTANGDTDFLGINGGFRGPGALPDPLDDGFVSGEVPDGNTIEIVNGVNVTPAGGLPLPDLEPSDIALNAFNDLGPEGQEAAAEALPATFTPDSEPLAPDLDITIGYGDRFDLGSMTLGIFALVDYGSQQRNRNGIRSRFDASGNPDVEVSEEICEDVGFTEEQQAFCGVNATQWTVALNGYFTAGLEIDRDNLIKYTTLLLRQTTQNAIVEGGIVNAGGFEDGVETRIDRIENQVWFQQVTGEHYLSFTENWPAFAAPLQVDWRFSYSEIDREVPGRRVTSYDFGFIGGEPTLALSEDSTLDNFTQFLDLSQEDFEGGIDFSAPLTLFGREVDLKFGFDRINQSRDTGGTRYAFTNLGTLEPGEDELFPELIFSPENITQDSTGLNFSPQLDLSDYATVTFQNTQAYFVADVRLLDTLRLSAGFRYESSIQESTGFIDADDVAFLQLFPQVADGLTLGGGDFISSTLDETFFLPAATLTWEFAENWQVRAGYSQTVTRPDLREFSGAQFIDFITNDVIAGNPFLVNTELDNYDIRFEYYFGEADSLSFGAFYKDIQNPIERGFAFFGNAATFFFLNSEAAEIVGAEVELEIDLPISGLIDLELFSTKDFYFIGNFTYSQSDVDVVADDATFDIGLTNDFRRLVGQSDYLANVQFGYRDLDTDELLTILLNFTSNRISDLGFDGAEDVFEEPPILLDLIYQRTFDVGTVPITFQFRATNLLNDDRFFRQGSDEFVFGQFELGRSFSLSFTAEFL